MTSQEKEIINLIVAKDETDQVDFKKEYYSKEKKYDLIKDIVSFANNTKPRDKYIIFGIENATWLPLGINPSSLPDISEINDLLYTYVEPFINVELGSFVYNGITIGYIRIPHNELNRPYVILKEYNKNKITSLRKGEIYIRKGASNFICERNDLDDIYKNNGSLDISFHSAKIIVNNIQFNNISKLMGQKRIVIQNNTKKTVVFDDAILFLHCGNVLLEHKIDFFDDQYSFFSKTPVSLSEKPVSLHSGDCIQKTAYFLISETAAIKLSKIVDNPIKASLRIHDVLKHTYENTYESTSLKFSDDLLKKWGQ